MRILQSNLEASLAPGQGREGAGEGGGLQVESGRPNRRRVRATA